MLASFFSLVIVLLPTLANNGYVLTFVFMCNKIRLLLEHLQVSGYICASHDNRHKYHVPGEICLIVTLSWITTGHAIYYIASYVFGGDPWS